MAKTNNARTVRWVLILSLLANAIAVLYFGRKIYKRYAAETTATTPAQKQYYMDRDKLFDVLPTDTAAIVFLGNSLTQFFELAEIFKNPHIQNRGIYGDGIAGVLARLTPIITTKPRKIFIDIGVNDLEQQVPEKTILSNYEKLLDTLKKSLPSTMLYLQSLLPVSDSSDRVPTYANPKMNEKIVAFNEKLQAMAKEKGCVFVNVHPVMLAAKELNPKFSVDGVHISGEGYLAWAKILKPYVDE